MYQGKFDHDLTVLPNVGKSWFIWGKSSFFMAARFLGFHEIWEFTQMYGVFPLHLRQFLRIS